MSSTSASETSLVPEHDPLLASPSAESVKICLPQLEMKNWKLAQKKMGWQKRGAVCDRNIGGHIARIPDDFHFLSGSGPKGIGIDLSNRSLIPRLADAIVPKQTMSKMEKLRMDLEEKWIEHHGTEEQMRRFQREKKRKEEQKNGESPSQNYIAFKRSSVTASTGLLNVIRQLKAQGKLLENKVDAVAEEKPELPEPLLPVSTNANQRGGGGAGSKAKSQSKLDISSGNEKTPKKDEAGLLDEMAVSSPDSGFYSDKTSTISKRPLENMKIEEEPSPLPMKKASSVLDVFNRKSIDMLKLKRNMSESHALAQEPLRTQERLPSTSTLDEYRTKFRKAYRTTEVMSGFKRDRWLVPTTLNYELPTKNKNGYQPFTRRKTRGQMYRSLETVAYSDSYKKQIPSSRMRH